MDLDHATCFRAIRTRDARLDGLLFVAVKTTGIYCRPVCRSRLPRRQHLRFFPSAAAAQAKGFRPCLRCRPETAPDLAAWRGRSSVLASAQARLELGALDGGGASHLADRLGVAGPQLRRLFRRHVGASPSSVAQTRRVLLAKQLIHETSLPLAEVALASGFGSVRRFDEAFQRLFRRPPSALRRDGGASTARAPRGEVTVLLRYRPPYDWSSMLAFLGLRAIPGVETVTGEHYCRTVQIGDAQGTVRVRATQANALEVTLRTARLAILPTVIARLRRLFDLAANPDRIESHLAGDPLLARLIGERPGLRVPGAWDGFELAVRAILGQQITVVAAIALAGRLVQAHGRPLPPGVAAFDGLTHVFPDPTDVARADLSSLGMPRTRARALSALASRVADDPEILRPGPALEEAIARLRGLSGVGEWTAQYIAMRQLREPDAFPAADVGLLRALEDDRGRRPSPGDLLARAEGWRPWRAYAAQHLWTSPRPACAARCTGAGRPRSG